MQKCHLKILPQLWSSSSYLLFLGTLVVLEKFSFEALPSISISCAGEFWAAMMMADEVFHFNTNINARYTTNVRIKILVPYVRFEWQFGTWTWLVLFDSSNTTLRIITDLFVQDRSLDNPLLSSIIRQTYKEMLCHQAFSLCLVDGCKTLWTKNT